MHVNTLPKLFGVDLQALTQSYDWYPLKYACGSTLSAPRESCEYILTTKITAWQYSQTSNISETLVGNKIVAHSDVVGASPIGAAPTTSHTMDMLWEKFQWIIPLHMKPISY